MSLDPIYINPLKETNAFIFSKKQQFIQHFSLLYKHFLSCIFNPQHLPPKNPSTLERCIAALRIISRFHGSRCSLSNNIQPLVVYPLIVALNRDNRVESAYTDKAVN